MRETYGSNTLDFFYDASGHPYALKYNGTTYYYITNLQGDVMYLIDANENTVASYEYDPYGNIVSATGTMAAINPLRYRGYYYDAELEMYYLQSRYYDPQICRFLNADSINVLNASESVLDHHLFAYCNNNPLMNYDPNGNKAIDVTWRLISVMISNAMYLRSLAKLSVYTGLLGKGLLLAKFLGLVKTGGKWDFKNQKEWQLNSRDYYVFFGSRVTVADVGNIHFGFVGSVIFSQRTLCTGAGIYQIYSGTSKWKYWYSYFDDPRDTACIKFGRALWATFYGRCVYQW